jgi:diacylglycerol kinase family enzyme
MVRRWAPPPSRRPAGLPEHRTVPDLPPLAILPLGPAGAPTTTDLAGQLGLPRDPAAVAAAVLGDRVRRLDLLRQDGGSVTLDGALLGSSDQTGAAVTWRARVEVDDALLSAGDEPLLVGVVANAGGHVRPDGLPLVTIAEPDDGQVVAAVAVPVRGRWRRRVRVEVRRARGRAVTVRPAGEGVACLDDGVAGELTRQRSWWVEPGAWAVYTG